VSSLRNKSKTTPFTIALKKFKFLGRNLMKVKDVCNEKYKSLRKKISGDRRLKIGPCSCSEISFRNFGTHHTSVDNKFK
jgi:hypothetical protein